MSKIKTTESGRPLCIESSKPQMRAYMAWWREQNREKYNLGRTAWANLNRKKRTAQARSSHLLKNFNISLKEFDVICKSQDYKCKICRSSLKKTKTDKLGRKIPQAYVDHNHKTGAIRGILCMNCNTGLGHFRDSTKLLRSAILYLGE